jgi:hypothetical protein
MNWIRSIIAKRRIKKAFGSYISPALVDRMIATPHISQHTEPKDVEFIWLWLDDGDENYDDHLRRVLELGFEFDAFTENILPPVVTFWFGAFPDIRSSVGAKDAFVDRLRVELGRNGKLLHGSVKARMGTVGSERRFAFGALTGCRSSLLSALAALDFGIYKEYEKHGG